MAALIIVNLYVHFLKCPWFGNDKIKLLAIFKINTKLVKTGFCKNLFDRKLAAQMAGDPVPLRLARTLR
jgi:hypothetical protein